MPEDAAQVPDQEGWWPRPVAGINPGHVVEHMFSSSLLFLRNQYIVCERLGGMPIGWWEASSQTSERGATGNATASYITHGPTSSARVEVVAEKEGRLWPIRLITIAFGDGALKLRFESEAVRGCGHAR